MKKLILLCTVIATALLSCSNGKTNENSETKTREDTLLEYFKERLNDPSSFEFVSWSDRYAYIQLRHSQKIALLDTLMLESLQKIYDEDLIIKDFNRYDNKRNCIHDTMTACSELLGLIKVNLDSTGCSVKQQIKNKINDRRLDFENEKVCDWAVSYADTAVFDTLNITKSFLYRAKNGFGALMLTTGEIVIK